MRFNDLLENAGHSLKDVAIMFHTPSAIDLRRSLLAMVEEEPDLFEAYQDNHPRNPESTLKSRKVAASFVVGEDGEGRFVGLYVIDGWTYYTAAQLDAHPVRETLIKRFRDVTYTELSEKPGNSGRAVFNLKRLNDLDELRGRLIVRKPVGRAYVRLAENCDLPVVEVARHARFVPPAPDWDEFVVSGLELRSLPQAWKARLREWRGVYHILDERDGQRYVGSAYGEQNLLGRWQTHVVGDFGVSVELAQRDPLGFRFSILELVSPTATIELVTGLEANWKDRLHTRQWGLNRN